MLRIAIFLRQRSLLVGDHFRLSVDVNRIFQLPVYTLLLSVHITDDDLSLGQLRARSICAQKHHVDNAVVKKATFQSQPAQSAVDRTPVDHTLLYFFDHHESCAQLMCTAAALVDRVSM